MKILQYLTLIAMVISVIGCRTSAPEEEFMVNAAVQEQEVAETVDIFVRGIVDADRDVLDPITDDALTYGHSSGRVQNKTEFLAELADTVAFDFITGVVSDQTIEVTGETAVVRHIFSAETNSNGTPGNLKLGMILVWQHQDEGWKLLARQAYRLPE